MSKSSTMYTIRETEEKDIESGSLLEVLENVAPVEALSKPAAKAILTQPGDSASKYIIQKATE